MSRYRTPLSTSSLTLSVLMPVYNERDTVESIVELGRRLAETRPTGIRIGIGMRFLIRLAARRRGRPT